MQTAVFEQAINQFAKDINLNAIDKGQWEKKTIGEAFFLVNTELAEAYEAMRKGTDKSPSEHIGLFTQIEEEIADAIIRLLDVAAHFNLRIGEAMTNKHAFNKTRPYLHGKKF